MATIRPYNAETDNEAIWRIWVEIGWLEPGDSVDGIGWIFADGQAFVGEVNGGPEVAINAVPGSIRHGNTDVPLSVITSLTTSRVARRQKVGSRLVGQSVAAARQRRSQRLNPWHFRPGLLQQVRFRRRTIRALLHV